MVEKGTARTENTIDLLHTKKLGEAFVALPPSSSSSPKGCSGGRDLLLFCDGLLCRSLLRDYFLSRSLLGNGFLCGCFFLNGHFNPPPLFRMGGLCEKFVNKSLLNVNKLLDDVRQRIF